MRVVVLILAAQTFFWPWQHARHHYRSSPAQQSAPDCAKINAVKKKLPPERYERALRSATEEEQKIIMDCVGRP